MTISKEEFNVLAMLYVANIDGCVKSDEIKVMIEKSDSETFARVNKMFKKMNDIEVLNCLNENKKNYITNDEERQALIDTFRTIVDADDKNTVMEKFIFTALEDILRD